jgi:hypothetical protein
MAIISALLSLLSRKLGQLLRAVFGWAIPGLFGRLPSSKQTVLSAALILVIGVPFPGAAAWAVSFVPLHECAPKWVLRIVWLALALTVPLIVGAIVRWVPPPSQHRRSSIPNRRRSQPRRSSSQSERSS